MRDERSDSVTHRLASLDEQRRKLGLMKELHMEVHSPDETRLKTHRSTARHRQ